MLISDVIPGTQTAKMVSSGRFIAKNLRAEVESGRPIFGARMVVAMAGLMSLFTPAICRVENWPSHAYQSQVPRGVRTCFDR
jgi:hypothetical protein